MIYVFINYYNRLTGSAIALMTPINPEFTVNEILSGLV